MKQIDIFSIFSAQKNNNENNREMKKNSKESVTGELERQLAPSDENNIHIGELFSFNRKNYVYIGVKEENHAAGYILAIQAENLRKYSADEASTYIEQIPIKSEGMDKLHVPLTIFPGRCTGYWLDLETCEQLIIGHETEEKNSYSQPCWLSKKKTKRILKEVLKVR